MNLRDQICSSRWLPWLGRIGFTGRGLAYLVVGVFVLYAAVTARTVQGWKGAFIALRDMPLGIVAVFVLTMVLAAFILWRLVEALLDPENIGHDFKGLAMRGVRLVSAIVYGGLAWKALSVLLRHSQQSDDSDTQHATALAMSEPLGRWLVLAIGLIVIIVGLVQLGRSVTLNVHQRLGRADHELAVWIAALGRIGLLARGLVLTIIGGFFLYAAWIFEPQKARSMSGALRTIEQQPYGAWLLGLVGAGVVAFGLFGLAVAYYRRFTCAAHSSRNTS